MIPVKLKKLKDQFEDHNIDGYVIPKNDEFFSEFSNKDRLNFITGFSGSAGLAVILKNKNYLFVDGRYTLQAKIQSGKKFKIIDFSKIINVDLFQNLTLGVDPKLFTSFQIKNFFLKKNKIKLIEENLIDNIFKSRFRVSKPFYYLDKNVTGESHLKKIDRVTKYLNRNKLNHIFITAPENVAWLLNIRGHDNPTSPIPNSYLILSNKKDIYLITDKKKSTKLIKQKRFKKLQIIEPKKISKFLKEFKSNRILLDEKTCNIYLESILNERFKILKREDPIYLMKSIKNKIEINNMINAHIIDGVALTKFIYWLKKLNKKRITEVDAQNKLEKFRKLNSKYLFASFDTIAGSGKNGAIIHYRASKNNTKYIKKDEIFLCDSGGQYKYGTTDVTRTISFSKQRLKIKNIFTKVLKGHIAVAETDLNKKQCGKQIDIEARKFLKNSGLNYNHGTGHGVGFFLNVHEGPQSISKYNSVKIKEGMILSNEPGFYQKGKFGIRIENLVYAKRTRRKFLFKNLTLAPIEKDLINFDLLNSKEKNYLFRYHLEVYSKLSGYLNKNEKKWLASLI